MKTKLPRRSLIIQDRLDGIVKETLVVAKSYIAKIVLFGSYARGDWKNRQYRDSDLDIMIVLKKSHNRYKTVEIRSKIEKQLKFKKLYRHTPLVTLILEPIKRVNKELGKSQYFFSDIIKEGILLYDSGEFTFAETRELSWKERKQISLKYFENWFPTGVNSIFSTRNIMSRDLKLGAFYLHQATESFYNTILLVFTGYIGKEHDIDSLGKATIACTKKRKELLSVFPRNNKEEEDRFTLLRSAYVEARYEEDYKITKEELLYLISRVEILKEVTEKICEDQIKWLNLQADEELQKKV